MPDWIIPCNPRYYDVFGAFDKFKVLDWHQANPNMEIGDIVYIYVGAPKQAIMFKCKVNKVNLSENNVDDSEFAINRGVYDNQRYMELELLKKYSQDVLSVAVLQEHGVQGRIMGPRRMQLQLREYVSRLEK